MIHSINHMIGGANTSTTARTFDGKEVWVRSVPLPFFGGLLDRMRDAWWVLTGRAYAVRWPRPGDLERALGNQH